jgi:hypothetical protein
LKELLEFYESKFHSDNGWMVLKNLEYFEDADQSEEPEIIMSCPSWRKIKKIVQDKVNDYKLFKS